MPKFNLPKLIEDVFAPQPGETVLVLTDTPHGVLADSPAWAERREMAQEWQLALAHLGAQRGFAVRALARYAATGAHAAPFPADAEMDGQRIPLEETILASTLVVCFSQFSASGPLLLLTTQADDLRAASLPLIQRRMEQTALAADHAEIQRRVRLLTTLLGSSIGATLTFSTGQVMYFDLRHRQAHADDGYLHGDRQPPRLINLPSGEAYSATYEGEREGVASLTSGTIPVDYGGERVLFYVEQNRIMGVEGNGESAIRMRHFFEEDPARANIAELGLGVNPSAVVWGNVLEDEKAGIHWAYGRNDMFGGMVGVAQFKSPETVIHQDIVYAAQSPIQAETLTLHQPDGQTQVIYKAGWTVF